MTELVRGFRGKLGDSLDISQPFTVKMQTVGGAVYDTCCFGVDAEDKLSDDRYMVFYNQTSSPAGEITYGDEGGVSGYTVSLGKLPPNIVKLVFTVSIDGEGTMGQIQNHSISIWQNGAEMMRLVLNGSDFANEKAIIGAEIYLKTVWRIAVVASGFNGGLADLLANYGGELADEPAPAQQAAPAPAPAPQPQAAPPIFGQVPPPSPGSPPPPEFFERQNTPPMPPPQPQYGQPAPPMQPQYGQPAPPPQPQYGQPAPPPQPQYGQPAPPMQPQYGQPAPPMQPQYGQPAPPPQPQYGQPAHPMQPQYGQPAPPPQPQYGQPAPPPQPQYGQPSPPPQQFRQPAAPMYDPAAPVPPTSSDVPRFEQFRPAPFEVMPLPVMPSAPNQIYDYQTVPVDVAMMNVSFEMKPVNYETRPLEILPPTGRGTPFNYDTVPV